MRRLTPTRGSEAQIGNWLLLYGTPLCGGDAMSIGLTTGLQPNG
jgi:hypothetical protein